jgi:uncharacterized protein YbjT (DUF2867 family)
MRSPPIPIVIVGATGMLGGKIARALLAKGEAASVRVMVRRGFTDDPKAKSKLEELSRLGAEVVHGDLADYASLIEATRGMEVVVSALQGGPDVIVRGQAALLDAAKRNGVRRMVPSDFAVDLFEVEDGWHPLLNMRKEADRAVAASGLEHVHMLNGVFMEYLFEPQFGVFDVTAGTASYWGDGTTELDMTTTDDTARYTAEAALDRDLPSGKFAVVDDRMTVREAGQVHEEVLGKHLAPRSRGSLAELERHILGTKASNSDPMAIVPAAYQLAMFSGRAALKDIQNSRYPFITPLRLRDDLAQAG